MNPFRCLADAVVAEGLACLVRVASTQGSAPREANAWMVVRPSGAFNGTIGGGALEWNAIGRAQARLKAREMAVLFEDVALGPALGQCCGGRVALQFEIFDPGDMPRLNQLLHLQGNRIIAAKDNAGRVQRRPAMRGEQPGRDEWPECFEEAVTPVLLFGAGHVARALVLALAPLPFSVRWIETRDKAFPALVPGAVTCVVTDAPATEAGEATAGSFALVMTHSHALDLEIVAAALGARQFSYVGLIGSATKRARFGSQLQQAGLTPEQIRTLHCPIGLPDLPDKEPSIIAASVAADLLRRRAGGM